MFNEIPLSTLGYQKRAVHPGWRKGKREEWGRGGGGVRGRQDTEEQRNG